MTDEAEDCDEMMNVWWESAADHTATQHARRAAQTRFPWRNWFVYDEDRVLWWANESILQNYQGDDEEDCFLQDDTAVFFLTSSLMLHVDFTTFCFSGPNPNWKSDWHFVFFYFIKINKHIPKKKILYITNFSSWPQKHHGKENTS